MIFRSRLLFFWSRLFLLLDCFIFTRLHFCWIFYFVLFSPLLIAPSFAHSFFCSLHFFPLPRTLTPTIFLRDFYCVFFSNVFSFPFAFFWSRLFLLLDCFIFTRLHFCWI